jgi:hypothetical protein
VPHSPNLPPWKSFIVAEERTCVVIYNQPVALGRNAATRAGWNDAAWGRPRRYLATAQATWYQRGYAGGLLFRQEQEWEVAQRTVVTSALPRVLPAA